MRQSRFKRVRGGDLIIKKRRIAPRIFGIYPNGCPTPRESGAMNRQSEQLGAFEQVDQHDAEQNQQQRKEPEGP